MKEIRITCLIVIISMFFVTSLVAQEKMNRIRIHAIVADTGTPKMGEDDNEIRFDHGPATSGESLYVSFHNIGIGYTSLKTTFTMTLLANAQSTYTEGSDLVSITNETKVGYIDFFVVIGQDLNLTIGYGVLVYGDGDGKYEYAPSVGLGGGDYKTTKVTGNALFVLLGYPFERLDMFLSYRQNTVDSDIQYRSGILDGREDNFKLTFATIGAGFGISF